PAVAIRLAFECWWLRRSRRTAVVVDTPIPHESRVVRGCDIPSRRRTIRALAWIALRSDAAGRMPLCPGLDDRAPAPSLMFVGQSCRAASTRHTLPYFGRTPRERC